jgi:hypothetical protein
MHKFMGIRNGIDAELGSPIARIIGHAVTHWALHAFCPAGQTQKFMGIRNGIDAELWSPTENKYLPVSYDADTVEEGKRRCVTVCKGSRFWVFCTGHWGFGVGLSGFWGRPHKYLPVSCDADTVEEGRRR